MDQTNAVAFFKFLRKSELGTIHSTNKKRFSFKYYFKEQINFITIN